MGYVIFRLPRIWNRRFARDRLWKDGVHLTVSSGESIWVQVSSTKLNEIVAKALEGERLSKGDAIALASPGFEATEAICDAASDMRLDGKGRIVYKHIGVLTRIDWDEKIRPLIESLKE